MARIEIRDLRKEFDAFTAVEGSSFTIVLRKHLLRGITFGAVRK